MKQTTTLAPQRRPGQQTLKSALQRLTMTLSKGMPIEITSSPYDIPMVSS
jgi:hypothetical protein